jgi:predicted dehydrogenase
VTGDPHDPIRFGIVGCGDVTEVKSGPAFAKLPGATLSAVMRRDGAKARDYAQRHGVPRWTDDAAVLIEGDDVDVVYVATPPSSHAGYVRAAAAAGKPVYVEKPMGLTLSECEGMNAACRRAGVPLFVAYYRRALPRFERARELIQGGAIGTPRMVRLTLSHPAPSDDDRTAWRFDPEIAGGGLFMDLGSHAFDLLDHWLGPITDVDGHAVTLHPGGRVEDEVSARFTFASGVHGVAVFSFSGRTHEDRLTVLGTHGRVTVPVFADGAVVHVGADGTVHAEEIPHPEHVQMPLIAQMVEELRGGPMRCVSTGVSAARTQGVLDAILIGQRRRRAGAP